MKKIKDNILVTVDQTIQDAMIAINSDPILKIALVVSETQDLIGVVTDGDIRRALLANKALNTSISEVMNEEPITVKVGAQKADLIRIMEEKGIESVPVVEERKVIGVETFHQISKPKLYQNPVFIMAGGFGTRLKPLTDDCPKPMLKVGEKPMLEIIIDGFVKSGFSNFYISTHYLPEKITEYFGDGKSKGINITYVFEESPLGTGGALGLLPENINTLPIIVINGDILTKTDFDKLIDFHCSNNSDFTMCVREYDYQVPFGVVEGRGMNVTSITEKPTQHFFVNAGIYVINNAVINEVQANEYLDMPTLLEQQIASCKNVLKFPIYEYWLDIGRMDDFNRAQRDFSCLGL